MMAVNKERRVCMDIRFQFGKSAAETDLMLQEAFREDALSKTKVYEWYSRFRGGEMSCEDQPRNGQPSVCQNDENLERICNTISADCCWIIDDISEITVLSWNSCQ